MFSQGDILKSKLRSDMYPKFIMVLHDPSPNKYQFNAVVILSKQCVDEVPDDEDVRGYISNSWNVDSWEKSSLEELKLWI